MHCHRQLSKWLISASMPFTRWTGPPIKKKSKSTTSLAVLARKRLGHFTVSSHEEQIASALHDRSGDWVWKGSLFAQGEARMAWLDGAGWHVVSCNWEWGVGGCTFCCRPFPACLSNMYSAMQLWEQWCHPVWRQWAASLVSLTKIILEVRDLKEGSLHMFKIFSVSEETVPS